MVGHRPRLLIVDDEIINRQVLQRIFEHTCEAETAADGMQALEILATRDFDLVLLDIMMPEINGLELLKIIRSSANLAQLPVILVSALDDTSVIARGMRLGANDYITKPIDLDIVQARVNTQIVLKQLTDERNRIISSLESANEIKSRMMRIASHDLKNPLNNMRMISSIIRNSVDHSDDRLMKMLSMMDTSIESMLHVVGDFLDTRAIANTEIPVSLEIIDSAALLRMVLNQYAISAYNKNIELRSSGQFAPIIGDMDRLQQAASNLVSNAIKYSPRNTVVTLEGYVTNGRWRLHVMDEGPGIPEEEQPYLFQPFTKEKISTKPTAGEDSTGLGLWIVAEMIKLQNGMVGYEMLPEGGSCFWLELPIAPS